VINKTRIIVGARVNFSKLVFHPKAGPLEVPTHFLRNGVTIQQNNPKKA
jgi:hypothetical protein